MTAGPSEPEPAAESGAGPVVRAAAAIPPHALVLVSVVSIQLGAAVAVQLFDVMGPIVTTFLRIALAAVLLVIARRRQIDDRARRYVWMLVLFGIVIAVTNLAFYASIARIPLGIAVAIEFMGPLGLAVITSRRLLDFVWVGLATGGLLLLTPDLGGDLDPLGVVFALIAGVGWASFVLVSPRVARDVGDAGLALGMVAASLIVLPVAVVDGGLVRLDPLLLVAALAVAVFSTALPMSLEFEALKRLSARAYGILVTMEPVAAVVVGAVILSQALPPMALAAIACITIAAAGVTITDRRAAEVAASPQV